MSKTFNLSLDSPVGVEQILAAFGEREYWLARLSIFSGIDTLESLSVDRDGSVTAILTKDVQRNRESSPLAKFFPENWRVVQRETWHPLSGNRVGGDLSITPSRAPGSAAGTALLAPIATGSRLKCAAKVEFKVPLIGGEIERMMGRVLVQNITALQHFTADWIAKHK
ncbi:hypothetical protein A5792_31390 [Mycolicibacterium peregrinum]|uniref:DUF2505 domain-containing protein n=1 Tax=Mycolicibacterium peregrinum TaxID=43304 RepID=A0A1A0QPR5_MYCPR|nr:hypothetical protein A5792_31390 [Mycolicibacterium peregrinum]